MVHRLELATVTFADTAQGTSDEAKQLLSANTNEMVAGGGFGLPWFIGRDRDFLLGSTPRHLLTGRVKQLIRKERKQAFGGLTTLL
jgi:2-hydroxychromene-2-carboxylate isomerase